MKIKAFIFWLIFCLLMVSCGAGTAEGTEFNATRAGELIRRNLLLGEDQYQVDDPRVFQYGNLHVDGPSGGILYRFNADVNLFQWLIEQHGLDEKIIDSADQLPLDFLPDSPRWWEPWKATLSTYYIVVEDFESGGERRLMLMYDTTASVIYVVEHFANMPGI